jgi:hypothetical protein
VGNPIARVAADVAESKPEALPAVTTTRSVEPTSALPSRYVDVVAPVTFWQAPPPALHRCHWYP